MTTATAGCGGVGSTGAATGDAFGVGTIPASTTGAGCSPHAPRVATTMPPNTSRNIDFVFFMRATVPRQGCTSARLYLGEAVPRRGCTSARLCLCHLGCVTLERAARPSLRLRDEACLARPSFAAGAHRRRAARKARSPVPARERERDERATPSGGAESTRHGVFASTSRLRAKMVPSPVLNEPACPESSAPAPESSQPPASPTKKSSPLRSANGLDGAGDRRERGDRRETGAAIAAA